VIAVVGLSPNWYRPSFFAAKYMRGARLPRDSRQSERERDPGETCYPTVGAIPEPVDIVDCFRQPDEMPDLARAAVAKGAKVFWMQLGLRNDEAAQIASAAGLDVVQNRCVKIEHARLMGGLHWAGVNTGVISAQRAR
jgi:predicted CoA-binding protein